MRQLQEYNFFKQLSDLDFVDQIILYGSRARQDHRERSDIDIALVCPRAHERDWFTVLDIIEKADTLLKIDCVRFDGLPHDSSLRKSIEADGIIVYNKEP